MTGVRTGPARLRAADAEAAFAAALQETGFVLDPAQAVAASRLRHLGAELCRSHRLSRHPRRGLYLWGPVGRGKTMLLDVFLRAAPGTTKRRVHFDEFHVHDPGDAAFLTRLLRTLQQRGTTLVATSNYPPEGLLPNPLHHHLILPALELLVQQADVLGVAGPVDYRTRGPRGGWRTGFGAGAYVVPGDAAQLHDLALAAPAPAERGRVPGSGRRLHVLAARDDLVWFDARALCDQPTSPQDYLAVADRFPAWVISDLPPLAGCNPDMQQRFANVVDVPCDREVPLTLFSRHPLTDVLAGARGPADLARTASRLAVLRQIVRPVAAAASSS